MRHLRVTLLQNLSIFAVNFLLLLRIPVLLLLRPYSFFDGVFPTGSVLATGGVFNPSPAPYKLLLSRIPISAYLPLVVVLSSRVFLKLCLLQYRVS